MKNVALALMAYQHIGYFVYRDAYPFLIDVPGGQVDVLFGAVMVTLSLYLAQGFFLTHNREKYFSRLFILALVSQIPYSILIHGQLNVVFTYLLGFVVIYAYHYNDYLAFFALLILSYSFSNYFDWGFPAVLCIFLFYLLLKNMDDKKVTLDFFRLNKTFYYYFYPVHFLLLALFII